jgi:hypothetical protein
MSDTVIEDFRTVAEVRRELFNAENIRKGQTCPCCNKFMKMYHWTFLKSMVQALAYFYKYHQEHGGNTFVHFEDYLRQNDATKCRGAFNYLKYWNMIEKCDTSDDTVKARGYYRILPKGIAFLKGEIAVPKSMWLYDDEVKEWDTIEVRVKDIYKNFNYEEMVYGLQEKDDE